jgi:transposase-like protein
MYSYEDRIRAVELYIDCGKSAATVVRQLGYPAYSGERDRSFRGS